MKYSRKDWKKGTVKATCTMCRHTYWCTIECEAHIKAGRWASICRDCSVSMEDSSDGCIDDDSKQLED
jgi:hypothetical protein